MADNVIASAGSGGATFATDDIGGIHYPRSKIIWGPDGTANDTDIASGKPLPIQVRSSAGIELGTNTNPMQIGDASGAITVDGTITDGGSGKTLKRAVVSLTATGDVIAAVASKKLKIFCYELQSRNDSMTVQLRDGAAGSSLSIRWALNTRELAISAAVNPPTFLLVTSAGSALQAVITGTGTVDIAASYWDDDAS